MSVLDISKLSINELKVMAFDEARNAERSQNNVKALMIEINKRESMPTKEIENEKIDENQENNNEQNKGENNESER